MLSFKRNKDDLLSWSLSGEKKLEGAPRPLHGGGFVMKLKTGTQCLANRMGLNSMQQYEESPVLYLSTGSKGARCVLNVTGDRLGKVDWATNGTVQDVQVVERLGNYLRLHSYTSRGLIKNFQPPARC